MNQQIIHNTGINYTLYYNVLNYFKTIMKNHPSIGAATYGELSNFDLKEYPKYPIGNINITNTELGFTTTTYTVELTIADKVKNKDNESDPRTNLDISPFFGDSDEVYLHSNTLGIINDLTSYTQRGVAGFEIDGDISCIPFVDRFDNGLAGWVATFSLTTHNDKNRCLFFLVNPTETGYIIKECLSGDEYKAEISGSVTIGQTFSTYKNVNPSTNYNNLVCYNIVGEIGGAYWDFINLPILALPYQDYGDCQLCELWINPKVWSTTPASWSGPNADIRTWAND